MLHLEQGNQEARQFAILHARPEHEVAEKAARARLEWLTGPHGLLTIVDAETGFAAGKPTLRSVVPPAVADVGHGVTPACRGRGFAARALRLITPWALGASMSVPVNEVRASPTL
ncbi:GNAT family N-acetyltransferase [Actinokineospora sp. G85]|uniref:GNAT family N-acetyltransferase n=1 Tax=Actinokineospora sp. G85 TaxID=3406626 RepID=UPI003C795A94